MFRLHMLLLVVLLRQAGCLLLTWSGVGGRWAPYASDIQQIAQRDIGY